MLAALAAPVLQLAALVCLVSAACAGSLAPSFCDSQPGWKLDWQDEFDGDSLNASSWSALDLHTYDIGSCRDAVCLPDNVQVAGGALLLRSERRQVQGYNFTTGAVRTKGKRSWTATAESSFRVCVSAILPGEGHGRDGAAQGIWPAHWMMPDTAACWPDLGEMDILEMINGDGRAHATYHWDSNFPAKNCTQVRCALPRACRAFKHRPTVSARARLVVVLRAAVTRTQPDGHKLHGSYKTVSTWDSQFHECASSRPHPHPHARTLTPALRFALERGPEHVAFVYDGLLVLNVSLAAFPDVKFWQVCKGLAATGGPPQLQSEM
jgi:hypothetical protein